MGQMQNVKIDLEADISPNSQVMLYHLTQKRIPLPQWLSEECQMTAKKELVEKGYLLSLTERTYSKEKVGEFYDEGVKTWIDEYRALFKAARSGKMGDPKACLVKMEIFMKENPQYDKDIIMEAARLYISETDLAYLQQADYFISKKLGDGVLTSRLRQYCERASSGEAAEDKEAIFEINRGRKS